MTAILAVLSIITCNLYFHNKMLYSQAIISYLKEFNSHIDSRLGSVNHCV
jgi:hypothetical protein